MIEVKFRALFGSFSCITELLECGSTGIYPVVLPTKVALPALVYSFIGATTNPTWDTAGFTRYRVEINCFADTYRKAATLRSAVVIALNGYVDGNMAIESLHPIDFYDHELNLYRCLQEFYVSSVLQV